jgi:hypothetical protein
MELQADGMDEIDREWKVLFPEDEPSATRAKSVDQAMVLRGRFSGVDVLWLGGASARVIDRLSFRRDQLRADLVVAVGVTGVEPLPGDLLTRVAPQLAVVVTAPFPAAARISEATRKRLRLAPVPVVFTDEVGAVEVTFTSGHLDWRAFGVGAPEGPPPGLVPAGHRSTLLESGAAGGTDLDPSTDPQ